MRKIRMIAVALAMLLALCQTAFAEQAYVNLDERFGNEETYEFDGQTYYLKNRVKTTLVLCANLSEKPEEGVGKAEMILLVPVDDDSKTITPIQLNGNMLAAWLEGEEQGKTLAQLFAEAESAEAACARMVEAVNALFPTAVVEQYAALDLRGLPVLDGIENDETNVTGEALIERMKAIKATVEQSGDVNLNAMLSDLSGYIITDMKSGAMMKVVDKAERYDRVPRTMFPVVQTEGEIEAEEPLNPDLSTFEEFMLGVYYDDTSMW